MLIDFVDIIIPTFKPYNEIQGMVKEIEKTCEMAHDIIATCLPYSASVNRNFGLLCADSNIIIMVDDDIRGFFKGWDYELLLPFSIDPNLCVVSARLITNEGEIAPTCSGNYDISKDYIYIEKQRDAVMPSSAIAFKNKGIKFDDNYIGSGWEDTDFFFEFSLRYPNCKFMINNKVQLIHLNEMKGNQREHFEKNKQYFYSKWKL